jgi:hypothetical protein
MPQTWDNFQAILSTGRMVARNEVPDGPFGDGRREERNFSGGYFAAGTGFPELWEISA